MVLKRCNEWLGVAYTKVIRGVALLCLSMFFFPVAAQKVQSKQIRPNVLFIAIDDLNDYVSVLDGFPGIKTPNLEKFAKTALNFTRTYCAAPVCNPSRTALLSGIAPYHSGVYDNRHSMANSEPIMQGELLPEHFKQHGYTTLTRGKVFHTIPSEERYAAMWDRQGGKGNYGPNPKNRALPSTIKAPKNFNYFPWEGPESDHPDNHTADTVAVWLQQSYDKPFFMAIGLYKPHNPWTAPKRFFDMYPLDQVTLPPVLDGDWDDLPAIAKKWATSRVNFNELKESGKWKEVVQSYLACISFMDWNLGRMLSALDSSAYRENTIVCLFADNGFHLGEKGHFAKYALWEKTTRVLHMWRVPGMTPQARICERPVSLLDIYPTLAELCGLPFPSQQLDGRSILQLLKEPDTSWDHPAITTYLPGNQSVRTARYRYIRYSDGGEELYDELEDPNEWHNLAQAPEMQEVIGEMKKSLQRDFVRPVKVPKN